MADAQTTEAAPPQPPADAAAKPDDGLPATAEEALAGLPPIIIKKVVDDGHGGAHGGAWKIALADMMTAMMAFFLLMWILGATNESQRKSIADYFKPTSVVTLASKSGGANGFFGGMSIIDPKALPSQASQTGLVQLSAPGRDPNESTHPDQALPEGLNDEERRKIVEEQDNRNFEELQARIKEKLASDKKTQDLLSVVKFVNEKEGLRIEILDTAGFSMFASGTNTIEPRARELISQVGESLKAVGNQIAVRGHTDAYQFKNSGNNNWALSASRADATRTLLVSDGVTQDRFSRIEGVADSQPVNPQNPLDPKNRRISITVLYRNATGGPAAQSAP